MKKVLYIHGDRSLINDIGEIIVQNLSVEVSGMSLRTPAEAMFEALAGRRYEDNNASLVLQSNLDYNHATAMAEIEALVDKLTPNKRWLDFHIEQIMQLAAPLSISNCPTVLDNLPVFERYFSFFHVHCGFDAAADVDPNRPGCFIPAPCEAQYAFNQFVGWYFS